MLTNEERLRALKCNLKNHDWSVIPQFRIEKEDAAALLDFLNRNAGNTWTENEVPEYRRFTIWGESIEELENASEHVDAFMDQRIGRNIVNYQIMGEKQPHSFDAGFITDEALKELMMGFIVVPDEHNDNNL